MTSTTKEERLLLGELEFLHHLQRSPGASASAVAEIVGTPSAPDVLAAMTASGLIEVGGSLTAPRYWVTKRGSAALAAEPSGIFDLDPEPGDHTHSIWFVAFAVGGVGRPNDNIPCDVLGTLLRRKIDDRLLFVYRYRYDAGTKNPLDDRKSYYYVDFSRKSPDDASVMCERMMKMLSTVHPRKTLVYEHLVIEGGADKLYEKLKGQQWCTFQQVQVPDVSAIFEKKSE